jgi:hypothetical protein
VPKRVTSIRVLSRRGLLFICHGFGEHCGRYDSQAAEFNKHGILVFSHDHQGHGRSGGERGDIADYRYCWNGGCLRILYKMGRIHWAVAFKSCRFAVHAQQ